MAATKNEMMGFELGSANLYEIEVIDRKRKDYGDLQELADTFKRVGMVGPIAVMRVADGYKEGITYKLLAGGRRYAACLTGGINPIPIRIYPATLDEFQQLEIEHVENLYRKDLTVEESVSMVKELHDAKTRLYGEQLPGPRPDGEGQRWSQAMTAELIGKSKQEVGKILEVARAAEKHPEILKAKTMTDAKKMAKSVSKKAERKERVSAAAAAASEEKTSEKKKRLLASYILGDALEGISQLPPESFDLIEIDPPYAVDFKAFKERTNTGGSTTLDYNEIAEEDYAPFMRTLIEKCYTVMKPDSWLILWHANNWERTLYKILKDTGLRCRLLPAIWSKADTPGQTVRPREYLARGYEQFFYASKGDAAINKMGRCDVFSFGGVPSSQRCHPTERPIELMQEVLETFSEHGSSILVPFAGSGNTLLAASNLYSSAIGFDLSEAYKNAFSLKALEGEIHKYTSKVKK